MIMMIKLRGWDMITGFLIGLNYQILAFSNAKQRVWKDTKNAKITNNNYSLSIKQIIATPKY